MTVLDNQTVPSTSAPLLPPSHILPPNLQKGKKNNHNKTSSHQQGSGEEEEGKKPLGSRAGGSQAGYLRGSSSEGRGGPRSRGEGPELSWGQSRMSNHPGLLETESFLGCGVLNAKGRKPRCLVTLPQSHSWTMALGRVCFCS